MAAAACVVHGACARLARASAARRNAPTSRRLPPLSRCSSSGRPQRARQQAPPPLRAADEEEELEEDDSDAEDELEDELDDSDLEDEEEGGDAAAAAGSALLGDPSAAAAAGQPRGSKSERRVLRVTQQQHLSAWEPVAAPQQQTGELGEQSDAAQYADLLAALPGLQRELRVAAQERAGMPPPFQQDPWTQPLFDDMLARMPRKAEPVLDEWDLRAKMEKKKRQQAETDEWNAARAAVGRFPSLGADWRTDVRIQETGDPTDPVYREWTHKEIWDLITLNGRNADPRDVRLFVLNPKEIADAPAQGAEYHPDPEEWFEAQGRLIGEGDLALIASSAAGEKDGLLGAEFENLAFDDTLTAPDYDAAYGGAADDDDGF